MRIRAMLHTLLLLFAASLAGCDNRLQNVTYVDDVGPILQAQCAGCHSAGKKAAVETGFLVDSYASVMRATRFGPVIIPGSAITSSLYNLISGDTRLVVTMPHGKPSLSAEEIETIRVWIDNGAVEN